MRLTTKTDHVTAPDGARTTRAQVIVIGDIDMASMTRLRNCLDGLIDGGCQELSLDLSQVSFMDSSGLRVLLDANRRLAEPRLLLLRRPSRQVLRVLEVACLTRAFFVVLDGPAQLVRPPRTTAEGA